MCRPFLGRKFLWLEIVHHENTMITLRLGPTLKPVHRHLFHFFHKKFAPFFVRPIPVLQLITVIIKFKAKGDNNILQNASFGHFRAKTKMFRLVRTINVFLHTKHTPKLFFHLSYSKQYNYYLFFRMLNYYIGALINSSKLIILLA